MMNNNRIIGLLTELVFKQEEMGKKQDSIIFELKELNKKTSSMERQIEKNTLAISELRLSNMKLIDIIEQQVFERIGKLEKAVFS